MSLLLASNPLLAEDAPDQKTPAAASESKVKEGATQEIADPKVDEKWKGVPLDAKTKSALDKQLPATIEDLKLIESQVDRVLKKVQPATVGLQIGGSAGSGVIVTPEGLILTAAHVTGGVDKDIWIYLSDGRRVRGKSLGLNHGIDSGMIKITEKTDGGWPFVPMAKSNDLKLGEWVVATGHPGGYDRQRTAPVRLGRVLFQNNSVICTDCTLVGGDSGGPLFNMKGEVVGIHSRIGLLITNNFHVPIETYHTTWDRLIAAQDWGGRRNTSASAQIKPYLGINLDGLEKEPVISQVTPGSPAFAAGLLEGDLIRSLDGEKMGERVLFAQRILSKKPGQTVEFEVIREGKPMMISVQLGMRNQSLPGGPDHLKPEPTPEKKPDSKNAGPKTDPKNQPADDKAVLSKLLGIETDPASLRCIISSLVPNSAADAAGLISGDVVTSFDGKEVKSPEALRVLVAASVGKTVEIGFLRNGMKETRSVKIP